MYEYSSRNSIRGRAFLAIGSLSARLPSFRGRTRFFLELYRLLGLTGEHVRIRTRLRKPVRYEASLDLHSWLQRIAFLTGGYEDETVRFLSSLHLINSQKGYLLDVGANIGLISIPFAKLHEHSDPAAVAIEAVPDNVRGLEENISLNQLSDRIRTLPFAAGSTRGTQQIQVEGNLHSGQGTGTANILPENSTHECVRQEIRVETLDHLSEKGLLPRGCSVMKLDTDGYDLKVLQGGREFLTRERPVIYGEFSAHCLRWHDQSIADVQNLASQHEYEVWVQRSPSWRFSSVVDQETFQQDLLLLPAERRELFAHVLI